MTLNERIAALKEISPQTIKSNFTFDDYKFEILTKVDPSKLNYDNLSTLFIEVDKFMEDQPLYNIFSERMALKLLYLYMGYDLDLDLLNSMLFLEPLILLDQKLEDILSEDKIFQYMKEMFKEHKVNNGLTLATVMRYMSTLDLNPMMDEFKKNIGDLNKLAQPK